MNYLKTRKIRYGLAVSLVILLLLEASLVGASNETAASLTIEARDANGNLMTSGRIILYTEDYKVVGGKKLDSDGRVKYSNLEAGTYNIELYKTIEEFWGGTDVTIPQDGNTEVTVTRAEPYVTDLELAESTQDETYRVGESITISPKVSNDQSFPREVRVNISVDTNGDKSPETSVIRGPLEISGGGSEWYGYDYTPSKDGSVAVRVIVESKIADKWVRTGDTGWGKTITIAAKDTPAEQNEEDVSTAQQDDGPAGESGDSAGETDGSTERDDPNVILLTGIVVTMALVGLYAASKILGG